MVSMQQKAPLTPLEERKKARAMTFETFSSKKRKWKGETGEVKWKADYDIVHVELQLDTPLPVEWQRCLDIKSGQIHFYNTRTQKRTSDDPRQQNPEPNLDLGLNLTCKKSVSYPHADDRIKMSLSDVDHDRQEMVAGVCTRCHMLVVMCKAAPSCPNCKFVHTPHATHSVLKLREELDYSFI